MSDKPSTALVLVDTAISPSLSGAWSLAKAFLGDNDDAVRRAIVEDYQETVDELKRRVDELEAKGFESARPPPAATATLVDEFISAVRTCSTSERREALLNAMAKQFVGGARESVRRYWWNAVRSASDDVISIVAFVGKRTIAIPGGAGEVRLLHDFPAWSGASFRVVTEHGQPIHRVDLTEALTLEAMAKSASDDGLMSFSKATMPSDEAHVAPPGLREYVVVSLFHRGLAFYEAITQPQPPST